jgi:hypothetical protein
MLAVWKKLKKIRVGSGQDRWMSEQGLCGAVGFADYG